MDYSEHVNLTGNLSSLDISVVDYWKGLVGHTGSEEHRGCFWVCWSVISSITHLLPARLGSLFSLCTYS